MSKIHPWTESRIFTNVSQRHRSHPWLASSLSTAKGTALTHDQHRDLQRCQKSIHEHEYQQPSWISAAKGTALTQDQHNHSIIMIIITIHIVYYKHEVRCPNWSSKTLQSILAGQRPIYLLKSKIYLFFCSYKKRNKCQKFLKIYICFFPQFFCSEKFAHIM